MIRVCVGKLSLITTPYFDINSDTQGEIEFVLTVLNTLCPKVLASWRVGALGYTFYTEDFDRWEILWCIDDEEGWPLAHKVYNYIKDFEFDVEIVEEKA